VVQDLIDEFGLYCTEYVVENQAMSLHVQTWTRMGGTSGFRHVELGKGEDSRAGSLAITWINSAIGWGGGKTSANQGVFVGEVFVYHHDSCQDLGEFDKLIL
jgi:hypothetical protein